MAVPRTTSSTWISRAGSGCRCGSWWRRTSDPAQTGVATPGDGVLVNSARWTGCPSEAIRDHRDPAATAWGRRRVLRLRDWLLSGSGSGARRFLSSLPSCGGAGPEDQLPVVCLTARRGPVAQGLSPLAAATDWVNVACPKCGGAAKRGHRHDGHLRRLLLVQFRYCSPGYEEGPFRPSDLAGGHLSTCTSAASSTPSFTCCRAVSSQGPAGHGDADFGEPFTGCSTRASVINAAGDVEDAGNGVDLASMIDRSASTPCGCNGLASPRRMTSTGRM